MDFHSLANSLAVYVLVDDDFLNKPVQRHSVQFLDEDSERITALERIISRVYEDMIAQRISEDNFNRILENSQTEQATLKNRVMLNRERLAQQTQEQEDSTL